MHDASTVLIYTKRLTVSRMDDGDYSGRKPLRVVLNPLRYSIHFGQRRDWHINRGHGLFFAIDRMTWRLWRARRFERRLSTKPL